MKKVYCDGASLTIYSPRVITSTWSIRMPEKCGGEVEIKVADVVRTMKESISGHFSRIIYSMSFFRDGADGKDQSSGIKMPTTICVYRKDLKWCKGYLTRGGQFQ